ncbi:MAG: FkbM family methyltransferase [Methylococcales bacterium]
MRCRPGSASAGLMLYCNGRPEYHEMGFVEHYLRPGDRFVDIGANIGAYTLLAASIGAGTIDAFEPGPEALERLRENIVLNGLGNVRVHPVAVAHLSDIVEFTRCLDATNRVMIAVEDRATGVSAIDCKDACSEAMGELIKVPCARLDDVLLGQHYAMGKMDIEGAEPLALQGAEQMLSEANPPVWLLELNRALHAYGFTEQQLANWLNERGYDLALYDADSRTLRFLDAPWRERDNVLAIARVKRDDVAARLKSAGK